MHRYPFEREEHAAIRQELTQFGRAHIAPHALTWEEAGEFPRELYKTAAEVGFLGTGYEESVGGSGGDFSH
ncbi:MAG: acyl-CoA dehydrogenase family protein, partial [Polyangiales bacterium]